MSFGFLERLRRTIGFRLTLWYAAIFILSSLALFILAYFFLASTLRQKDHELILSRLKEVEAQFLTTGSRGSDGRSSWTRKPANPMIFSFAWPAPPTALSF